MTIYDVLDEWAGERFTDEVALRLAAMPKGQLDTLYSFYRDASSMLAIPVKAPGQLRPFTWNGLQRIGIFQSGLRYPPNRDATLRLLLTYTHGIVIPSELQIVFSGLTLGDQWESVARTLRFALTSYANLRDLADIGAVHWLETDNAYTGTAIPADRPYIDGLLDGESWSDWPEFDSGPHRSYGNAWVAVSQASGELAPMLESYELGIADVWLRHPFFERVLAMMLASGSRLANPDAQGVSVLDSLVRLDLPLLSLPNWGEILELRRHDPLFASWRTALGDALRSATDLASDVEVSEVRAVIEERLLPEADRLNAQVDEGKLRSIAKDGVMTFGLSGIGHLAATAAGSEFWPALAGAVVTGTAGTLLSHLRGTSMMRARKSLLAHYLTFAPSIRK